MVNNYMLVGGFSPPTPTWKMMEWVTVGMMKISQYDGKNI